MLAITYRQTLTAKKCKQSFEINVSEDDDERHSDDLGLTDLIDDFAPTDHFDYPTRCQFHQHLTSNFFVQNCL